MTSTAHQKEKEGSTMQEQVNLDEIINNIMFGISNMIEEQSRLNDVKAVLYMTLHNMTIYRGGGGVNYRKK